MRRVGRAVRRAVRGTMKTVQIITRLIVGGAQRIAIETAVASMERGHASEIWCGPQTGPEGSLAEEARARGIEIVIIPGLVKEVSPLKDGLALRQIAARLRRDRPDVVHTHSSKAGIVGRRAARSAGIARVLHTVHGWGFSERTPLPARIAFVHAERMAAGWADRLIAVSDAVREEGLRNGIGRPESYEVIRPGISVEAFADPVALRARGMALRDALGIPRDAIVAGTVTRLSPQKNPLMMLEAARKLPAITWLIAGDGPMRPEMERVIQRHGLSGRVHAIGRRTDVPEVLAALDLFVLTSLWEGLPLAILEAKAAGLPIVAALTGGVAEALPPVPAGWGYVAAETGAFIRALEDWSSRIDAAREAAMGARARACEEHSMSRMLDRILALY